MSSYLGAVWRCRYFWLSLVKMDLRGRYAHARLGMGWSVLQPLAMSLILCAVFRGIFHVPSVAEFLPYLLAGMAVWNFLLGTTSQSCKCFLQARTYINQYPAPLAIYPLRTALCSGFYLLLAVAVALLATGCLRGFGNPWALFSLFPALALLLVLGWSLSTLSGLAYVHFRDTQYLLELGFQALFYLTPIIYKVEALQSPRATLVMRYHPLVPCLRLLREPILDGRVPSAGTFAAAGLLTLAAALAAVWALRRLERNLIYRM
jgi:ABC-type polysaccharide/polyol phosphate export permease